MVTPIGKTRKIALKRGVIQGLLADVDARMSKDFEKAGAALPNTVGARVSKERRGGRPDPPHAKSSRTDSVVDVVGWLKSVGSPITETELVDALQAARRTQETAALSQADRAIWDLHSGIPVDDRAGSRGRLEEDVVNVVSSEAAVLTAAEVAANLEVAAATVRHYRTDGTLYSHTRGRNVLFPTWQFTDDLAAALPSLAAVLAVMPADLHPRAVEGFFKTPTPDLSRNGQPTSPREWLMTGGSAPAVVRLAEYVGAGY